MAATLVNSRFHMIDGETSLTGVSITAVWYVTVSEATTPQRVVELAQGADNSDDDNRPVPALESPFSTHLDSQTTPDERIIATRIRATQRRPGPDHRTKWKVTVVYENPSRASRDGSGRELDIEPEQRVPRFRTEQFVINETRDVGANRQEITYAFLDNRPDSDGVDNSDFRGRPRKRYADAFEPFTGPNGPITDASGRRVADLPTFQRRLPVLVMKTNTLNPFLWISVMDQFTDENGKPMVNDDEWDVFSNGSLTLGKRRCMFLSAEISDVLYWGSVPYYELTVKVLYDKRGHDIFVRNEGVDYWRPLTAKEIEQIEKRDGAVKGAALFGRDTSFASGLPVPPPIVLNLDGTLRSDQTGDVDILQFRDLKETSFEPLAQRFKSPLV